MRHVRLIALPIALFLAGAGGTPARFNPNQINDFGAPPKPPPPAVDWRSLELIAFFAGVVVTVIVLWYRQLRFQEDLEGSRPRIPGDEG